MVPKYSSQGASEMSEEYPKIINLTLAGPQGEDHGGRGCLHGVFFSIFPLLLNTLVTPDLIVSALLFQWGLGIVVLKSLWIELRSMSPKNIYLGTRETAAQRRWPLSLSKSK